MNKIHKGTRKGFTLLEILLVIAAIGILAAIVLVAINPTRQISQVRNAQRRSDVNTIYKAIEQYSIDNGVYPTSIPTGQYKEICAEGISEECVDLGVLVPTYLAGIPTDPTGANYKVGINLGNNRISVFSELSENTEVAVNKFIEPIIVLAGAKDPSFDTKVPVGFNANVNTSALQSDGKIIVGGQFTGYQGASANRIIRLNPDGSRDTSFNTGVGFGSVVTTLSIQNDGKILVGGSFSTYQGASANSIIRLNSDGSIDTSFNIGTGFSSGVNTLALQSDGKIIVGGGFWSYQGASANSIIRLNSDGSRDNSFNMGTGFWASINCCVRSLTLQSDGKIIVGGSFSTYQGASANKIIRLNSDGSRDTSFNIGSGFDQETRTLTLQSDGKIIVGGLFNNHNGVAANRIVRLNSDGSRDTSFNIGTGFSSDVFTLSIQNDGKILVGGRFSQYNGETTNRMARLNSNGSRDTSFNIGTGISGDFGSDVFTLSIQNDGKILVGGLFTNYNGDTVVNRIVRINGDGSRDVSFNMGTGFSGGVQTLALQSDGKIIVGGWFTSYNGETANRIIRLNTDGSRDNTFNIGTGFNSTVSTLALQSDGKILVGGWFTSYQGVAANYIVRLNTDGSLDTSFNIDTGFNSTINTISLQSDGKILVGGWFTSYQGVAANRIIRLNSNGSRDNTFNIGTGFNSTVSTLALQSDGKILVGGFFSTYQGVGANRIIRLNTDGSIDNTFNIGTGFSGDVSTLALQSDGKIIVGGWFTSYNGETANRIIRLNTDGSRDNTFNIGTGFNNTVHTLTLQSDGKVIVGGGFGTYQGVGANYIIRLNPDGSRDNAFNIGTGFNDWVYSLALQSDGKIIVGGGFMSYQDNLAGYLIRVGN